MFDVTNPANVSARDLTRNLTAGQHRALGVLLMSGSPQEAADAGGVSLRTLRRWQASAEFSNALRESARDSFREAHSQLLAAGLEVVATLRQALRTGSPAGRIRATKTLLELGLKVADGEIDERLERLEEAWRGSETEQPGLRILNA